MEQLVIGRAQTVAAIISAATPAAGQRFQFEDNPEINRTNIRLYGLEAFSEAQALNDKSGRTLVSAAGILAINFTLVTEGNHEDVQDMPVYSAIRSLNGGFFLKFKGLKISLTECFIELVSAVGVSADEVVLFNLYYEKIR
ncbi:MAG: hypothetical protein ACUZ8H_16460 [Candidatus Anammoxibacter sp.]